MTAKPPTEWNSTDIAQHFMGRERDMDDLVKRLLDVDPCGIVDAQWVLCQDAAARITELEALALAGQELAKAMREIAVRPSEMIWGEDYEERECLNNIEDTAARALAAWEKAVKGEG